MSEKTPAELCYWCGKPMKAWQHIDTLTNKRNLEWTCFSCGEPQPRKSEKQRNPDS